MENRSLNSEDPFLEDRAPASLESLPLELMWEILYRLDSQGLNSLVNISPQYYRAYTCNAQWILSEVVRREIGPECMYEAVAVIQASNIRSREDQATIEFLRRYRLERWEEPPQVLSLSASLQLISFHQSIVSGFVNDFISSTLSRYPMRQTPLKPDGPPSANELRRIYRAFYRFELYCVLFRRRPTEPRLVSISDGRLAASDQYRHFLYFLPPWEVEELFCVHDYLYRRIFVPVDDYLGHDIARGLQGSWWVEDCKRCDAFLALATSYY
ncbi:MAG: serine/threonine protein kinase [Chaenotheca gracillima]|nr:MAG: serine/threonine protein kinase [Chaenotheca gracillima]